MPRTDAQRRRIGPVALDMIERSSFDPPRNASDTALEVIRRFLLSPSSYPEGTEKVECIETHISLVFLTDQFAYKLKKPVRFEFLDFSTTQLRQRACRDELFLNRRLAPDVYLEVVPITCRRDGTLQMGGTAEPVDWLVKMRRLSDEDTLRHAIATASVSADKVAALADHLSNFYRRLQPVQIAGPDYRARIEQHIRANLRDLLESDSVLSPEQVRRIHAAQLIFLNLHSRLFDLRVDAGRVVDGHGDLRPEHIYLTAPPVIMDCIEFNAEFRAVDILDELSFLEMECAFLESAQVGRQVSYECLARLGDVPPSELGAFYKSYRACVRAKVTLLRSRQLATLHATGLHATVRQYVQLAEEYILPLESPYLIVICGHSGSGKSTIAEALAECLGIVSLSTDFVRQGLVEAGKIPADTHAGKYSPIHQEAVYQDMFLQANEILGQRGSVILDGTFLTASRKTEAVQLAAKRQARLLFVHCECPAEIATQRIAARLATGSSLSEARPELVAAQLAMEAEVPFKGRTVRCDTTRPVKVLLAQILEQLRETE